MNIDEILKEFGRRTNLVNLKLNDEGLCRLVFDSSLTVDIERTSSGFVLHSVVGQIPSVNKTGFMEMLLLSNGPDSGVGYTAVGADANMNEILLFQNFYETLPSYEVFEGYLDVFLKQIARWKARLSGDWESFEDTVPEKKEIKKSTVESKSARPNQTAQDFDPTKLPPGMFKA